MPRKTFLLTIAITALVGLTGCSDMTVNPPRATVAQAQSTIDKTFTTWAKQVPMAGVLQTKPHTARTVLPTACTNKQVQVLDTYAIYVTKDFDGAAFLDSFQTYLTSHGGAGKTAKDASGNNVINLTRKDYAYQILSLTKVKIAKLDTNKAILFAVTSPCVNLK